LLGLPGDATYANYREANRALWSQGILPLARKLLDALAEGLRPWFEELELGIDLDAVPALAEDRERLWAQVGAADFLTTAEKRAAVGLAPVLQLAENSNKTGTLEFKFNPWHDTEDGRFTFEGQGQSFAGGGGGFGGGGASGKWGKSKAPIEKTIPMVPKPYAATTALPSLSIRKISAGGYSFEADSQDRTVRAYGELRLQPDQPRSRSAQDNAGKPNREPKDHGGHYIAREFGGPEISYNHFAQNARFNSSDYRKLENEWKKELKAGKKVSVDIRSTYRDKSRRPDRISVTYFANGKFQFQSFPNPK
jgi:hypothetical protein